MTADDAFLDAVLEQPDDDTPRLMYADWLEERGDPKGEFIRLQCELARLPAGDARRSALGRRLDTLRAAHADAWRAELPELPGVTWGQPERGFVGTVRVD